MEFPYSLKITNIGKLLTPYCWLDITTHKKTIRKIKFLFDTGADFTSLPKFMAEVVGIDLNCAKQEIMYTANNESMITYLGKIKVRIDTQEMMIPCVFTDRDDTPFLLGRAGTIELFEILMSAKNKKLTFYK